MKNLVGAGSPADRGFVTAQADRTGMKQRHVVGEVLWGVPFGIQRDEERLHGVARSAEAVQSEADGLQVGRTDIRAIGEAEIDEQQLAPEIRVGARPPVMINESERPADRLAVPHHRIHQLGGGALRLRAPRRGQHRTRQEQCRQPEDQGLACHNASPEWRQALKMSRLPVEVWMTLSGICARASRRKFSPLQCIGMSTSGSSFLISPMTSLR